VGSAVRTARGPHYESLMLILDNPLVCFYEVGRSMLASVLMITYNHEAFISQAIESVLSQETDFDFELVIGEDCSPDATRRIVQSYERSYPHRVRPLYHERNVGMGNNLLQSYQACSGDYIAVLEGDDYWSDRRKLQKQVNFMENHPSHA